MLVPVGHIDCSRLATMLIGRCAWHPHYFGHPRWDRIASWQGWAVRFTDGICARCLERFREEHHERLESRRAARAAAAPREQTVRAS